MNIPNSKILVIFRLGLKKLKIGELNLKATKGSKFKIICSILLSSNLSILIFDSFEKIIEQQTRKIYIIFFKKVLFLLICCEVFSQ